MERGLAAGRQHAHGDDLTRTLLQGQIYFTGLSHLAAIAAAGLAAAACLPVVSRSLLLKRFFPEYFQANGVRNPRHELVFDVLVAGTLAVSASVIGVMAAFALVFLPPWVVFPFANGWRRTVFWTAILGVVAHVAAFALAIALDQPYGPMLVAVLVVLSVTRLASR